MVSQEEFRCDFFLQETHSNKATENQWQREWAEKRLFHMVVHIHVVPLY